MDDPWANAWGDSSKSTLSDSAAIQLNNASWTSPSISAIHGDNEDDLSAAPSWSARPTSLWESTDVSANDLWTSDTSSAWNPTPSTFDKISLSSRESVNESETPFPESVSTIKDGEDTPSSSTASLPDDDKQPPHTESYVAQSIDSRLSPSNSPARSPGLPPPPLALDPSDDFDAFGSFETATESIDTAGWSPSKPVFSLPSADATAWGGAWEDPGSSVEETASAKPITEDLDDAWERARQEKAKQDLYVPPELLSSVLQLFDDLSHELWPETESHTLDSKDARQWADLEQLGLAPPSQKLILNDLTLPANIPFPKTFTAKKTSEALKHTRHLPLTQTSPLAFYMSSKGLSSWEASLKASPALTSEDVTPSGWKIVETKKEDVPDENKKKSAGGLFSFFGRKSTSTPADSALKRSSSPVPSLSSLKIGASPRASLDAQGTTTPSPVVSQASTPLSQVTSVGSSDTKSSLSNNTTVTSPSPLSPPITDPDPVAPTVVSRFLGRFSRSRNSSSHESLALSADDLEFLSDVPTFDNGIQTDVGLDALSKMIQAPAAVAPLPPPLRPSPTQPIASSSKSVLKADDDFMSFFDSSVATPASSQVQTITPTQYTGRPSATRSSSIASNDTKLQGRPSSDPSEIEETWPSFDYPDSIRTKTMAPKRAFVPIMTSSSSTTPSATPPPLPAPTSHFSKPLLPPPPASNKPVASNVATFGSNGNSGIHALKPPPVSQLQAAQRQNVPSQPSSSQTNSFDEDDEFSDFLSSPPAQVAASNQMPFSDFGSGASHGPKAMDDLFDDFDDFASAPPPQPPAKVSNLSIVPQTRATVSKGPPAAPVKSARTADHSRTLSLMENVASRGGKWLAPPSPLPEALMPPPDSSNSMRQNSSIGVFSGGSSMQAQQARAAASLLNSTSSGFSAPSGFQASNGYLPPPPSMTPLSVGPANIMRATPPPVAAPASVGHQRSSTLTPVTSTTSASQPTNKTGGLSAQDLSFFEGL
ncbi:hypothetical protein CPC08DRAFT_816295 [Agrocybe pediades]|nr:hypothetical protein CPC08DRAFT_816295 [Agrocybe pediades]